MVSLLERVRVRIISKTEVSINEKSYFFGYRLMMIVKIIDKLQVKIIRKIVGIFRVLCLLIRIMATEVINR